MACVLSPITQILVEKCISGWKEIEFEVIRDSQGKQHHGLQHGKCGSGGCPYRRQLSLLAPAVTLANKEYQMLRTAAIEYRTGPGSRGRL